MLDTVSTIKKIPSMKPTKTLPVKMKGIITGLPLHNTFSLAFRCLTSCDKGISPVSLMLKDLWV
ncbi:MAG: hypothetical protein ACUVTD_09145 [Nitrososphaerales archaeon]